MTSSRFTRPGVALAALLILGSAANPAAAAGLPFTDPNAVSSIGLCDNHGNPITSGSLDSHAFVPAAAASSPAPEGYASGQGAKATLYAFQPRKGVDPGEWSGFQLTGGSIFSDSQHPLVAGTNLDPSLRDFMSAYPLRWDGLLQLRIYYTAPNRVVSRRTYPAAVLRVSGGSWTLVQGSTALKCDLSKVVSGERVLLPASDFDPKHPAVTPAPAPSGRKAPVHGSATPTARRTTPAGVGTSASTHPSGSIAATAQSVAAKRSSSVAGLWWGAAALAVLGLAGGMFLRRRRATDGRRISDQDL